MTSKLAILHLSDLYTSVISTCLIKAFSRGSLKTPTKNSSYDSTITSMYVEYGGCRGKGMHCGATARVSTI